MSSEIKLRLIIERDLFSVLNRAQYYFILYKHEADSVP